MFKVGDKVKIRKDSRHYGNGITNPKDQEGTVVVDVFYDGCKFLVKWRNGTDNYYRHTDIELYSSCGSSCSSCSSKPTGCNLSSGIKIGSRVRLTKDYTQRGCPAGTEGVVEKMDSYCQGSVTVKFDSGVTGIILANELDEIKTWTDKSQDSKPKPVQTNSIYCQCNPNPSQIKEVHYGAENDLSQVCQVCTVCKKEVEQKEDPRASHYRTYYTRIHY